jgi:aspartyl-tRNA(Asn)/glutamyl-tRNA(Gln) amidotransferase subunit A
LERTVEARFSLGIETLRGAGVRLSDKTISLLGDAVRVQARARFASIESFSFHRQWIPTRAADYDPRVRFRLEQGRDSLAADYIAMPRDCAALIRAMDVRLSDLDALVLPTTPRVAPLIAEFSAMSVEAFVANDLLLGRNTGFANFFDLCAISEPLPRESGLPVGLMLVARNGHDHHLFRIAAAICSLINGSGALLVKLPRHKSCGPAKRKHATWRVYGREHDCGRREHDCG